jgi:hypothetical protein
MSLWFCLMLNMSYCPCKNRPRINTHSCDILCKTGHQVWLDVR